MLMNIAPRPARHVAESLRMISFRVAHRAGRLLRNCPIEPLEQRTLLSTAVVTYHNDNLSTGLNSTELQLTPGNVSVATFSKRFSTAVDGQIYSQPLYVPGLNVTTGPNAGTHNTVLVATQHDDLYAIDGDSGAVLYQVSFLGLANGLPGATSVTTVPYTDIASSDITPEIGITSTPVIDQATGNLFLTAKTKQIVNSDTSNPHYVYRLYKVNIHNGAYSSTIIGDTIRNTTSGSIHEQHGDLCGGKRRRRDKRRRAESGLLQCHAGR